MTLCPIALLVGCKKCPLFRICPLKGVIGDHRKSTEPPPKQETGEDQSGTKDKP